jgi:hypothetical protein
MGLLGSPWNRRRAVQEGIVLMFLICLFLPLLMLLIFNSRYVIPFLLVLTIWAAKGLVEVGDWSQKTLTNIVPTASWARPVHTLAIVVAAGAMLSAAWLKVDKFEDLRRGDPALKTAGLRVKELFPTDKLVIMDSGPLLTFYAGGILRNYPYANEHTALRYIAANKINVLVMRQKSEIDSPYYRDWASKGIPDPRASMIVSLPSERYGRIVLYRWH